MSTSLAKKGGAWTNTVRYYSESGETCSEEPWEINEDWKSSHSREEGGKQLLENRDKGYVFLIDDYTLEYAMRLLIDWNEEILKIWVFNRPIFGWPFTETRLNHQFVVIQTANWWWSIEKNTEEIVIQRSKNSKGVLEFEDGKKRSTPLRRLSSDQGQKTMQNLIEFLFKSDELNNIYSFDGSNCQHFAEKVFNEFAKYKLHDVNSGCDPRGNDITMEVDPRVSSSKFWKRDLQHDTSESSNVPPMVTGMGVDDSVLPAGGHIPHNALPAPFDPIRSPLSQPKEQLRSVCTSQSQPRFSHTDTLSRNQEDCILL